MRKLVNISKNQISSKGVQSLADRPNANAQYGVGGLSSTQLKLWFDKLATFLADKINELQTTLASDDAADYIRIPLDNLNVSSFKELLNSFDNGDFANQILKLYPSASISDKQTLQVIINNISMSIADIWDKCAIEISTSTSPLFPNSLFFHIRNKYGDTLSTVVVDMAVGTSRIYDGAVTSDKIADKAVTGDKIADKAVTTSKIEDAAVTNNKIADKAVTTGKIYPGAVTGDKIYPGAVTEEKLDASLRTRFSELEKGAFTSVRYNPLNGELTFVTERGSTYSVDLPLELIVSDGYYDSTEGSESVVLVLANGEKIRIPVDDLIRDLATQSYVNIALNNYLLDAKEYSDEKRQEANEYTDKALLSVGGGYDLIVSDYESLAKLPKAKGRVLVKDLKINHTDIEAFNSEYYTGNLLPYPYQEIDGSNAYSCTENQGSIEAKLDSERPSLRISFASEKHPIILPKGTYTFKENHTDINGVLFECSLEMNGIEVERGSDITYQFELKSETEIKGLTLHVLLDGNDPELVWSPPYPVSIAPVLYKVTNDTPVDFVPRKTYEVYPAIPTKFQLSCDTIEFIGCTFGESSDSDTKYIEFDGGYKTSLHGISGDRGSSEYSRFSKFWGVSNVNAPITLHDCSYVTNCNIYYLQKCAFVSNCILQEGNASDSYYVDPLTCSNVSEDFLEGKNGEAIIINSAGKLTTKAILEAPSTAADFETIPVINRHTSGKDTIVDYKTVSQGASRHAIPMRTSAGALRTIFDKDFNGMATETEKNQQVVNLGYLNERLQGLGGGSLYIHDVVVSCSDYMNPPYGSVYLKFLTNESTPITTLAEIHNLQNKQLSIDFNYYMEDSPDGARDAVNAWVIAYSGNTYKMQISYVTAYTVPLTTESHVFNSDVCTISDTITEV